MSINFEQMLGGEREREREREERRREGRNSLYHDDPTNEGRMEETRREGRRRNRSISTYRDDPTNERRTEGRTEERRNPLNSISLENIYLPPSSSLSFSPPSPSSSFISTLSSLLSHFLRGEGLVKELWRRALKQEKEDFPRHFFNLCSLSPLLSHLSCLSLSPFPFSFDHNISFPLETHFSFFLHTKAHSFLHSSIGTFTNYLTSLPLPLSLGIPSPFSSYSSSSSLLSLEQLFIEMIDIIMYSCVEVKDIIESIYRDVYGHSKVPLLAQREFFLRTFFLNFLCSCLEQPQVVLSTLLSSETIAICSHFTKMLKYIISFTIQQPQQQPLHSSFAQHVQKQLETITSYLLWGEETTGERGERGRKKLDEKLMKGYTQLFLPFWEDYHLPCERRRGGKEEKHTCSMKEPSLSESFAYFGEFFGQEMEGIVDEIEERVHMGRWCLERDAVRSLGEWMGKKENREGFEMELERGRGEEGKGKEEGSPVLAVRFFENSDTSD